MERRRDILSTGGVTRREEYIDLKTGGLGCDWLREEQIGTLCVGPRRQETPCQRLQMREQGGGSCQAATYTALCAIWKKPICHWRTRPCVRLELSMHNFTKCPQCRSPEKGATEKLLPFIPLFILLAAVKFAERYCPPCYQTHWLNFIGRKKKKKECQIFSFAPSGSRSESRPTHKDILM